MASVLSPARAAAAKAVMARLREARTARHVPEWATRAMPRVVAIDTDLLSDVLDRCARHDGPVVLGVHYPATQEVEVVELHPRYADGDESLPPEVTRVGEGATIGTMLDAHQPRRWDRLLPRRVPVTR